MRCRQCGTDIADKALICYRCGTATTEAKHRPPATAARSTGSRLVLSGLVIVVLLALVWYLWTQ